MEKINKVSESVKTAIKRKSAYALPDNPTYLGYRAKEIKEVFYRPIVDETNSVIAEIDRVVDEANSLNDELRDRKGIMAYGGSMICETNQFYLILNSYAKERLNIDSAKIIYGHKPVSELDGLVFLVDASCNGKNFENMSIHTGDYVLATSDGWQKIDNTDPVYSVNGKTGAVIIDVEDLPKLQGMLNGKISINSAIKQPTQIVNGEEVQLGSGWNDWDTFLYAYSPKGKDSKGNLWFPNGPMRIKISQGFNPDDANSTNGLTIVQRVASGAICAATPEFDNEVTTKNYVDNLTRGKLSINPNGVDNLITENDKLSLKYMPDSVLGQLVFGGTATLFNYGADYNQYLRVSLTDDAREKLGITDTIIDIYPYRGYEQYQGLYFIAVAGGMSQVLPFAGLDLVVGDWLVATASGWEKVDNTDAVQSVNGKTGAVVVDAEDIPKLQGLLNGKVDKITTTADLERAYIVSADGSNSVRTIDINNTASSIVKRNASGQIAVSNPTSNLHAVNKQYVDAIVGDIETLLGGI